VRVEGLLWMLSGYTLCKCLDNGHFPWVVLVGVLLVVLFSRSRKLGLLSNACLPKLGAGMVFGGRRRLRN